MMATTWSGKALQVRSPTSPGPSRAREYAASKVKLEVKLEIAAVAKQLDPVAAVGSTAASAELCI